MPASTNDADYPEVTGYGAARREQDGRPPGFRMCGETFVGERVLRGASILDFAVRSEQGQLAALLGFLQDQLLPEAWERFDVMFRDRKREVTDDMVDEAVQQLFRQYTDRPTSESSSSPATPSRRGRNSKAGSSSPAPDLRSA